MRGEGRLTRVLIVIGLMLGLAAVSGWPQGAYSLARSGQPLTPGSPPHPPSEDPGEILLRSRRIAPTAGLEPGLDEGIRSDPGQLDGRAHVLLQLRRAPNDSDLQALEAAGIRLLNYIPRNGWFASMPAQNAEGTLARTGVANVVRWAGQIRPGDRVPARVWAGEFGAWAVASDGRVRLLVSFFDDVPLETGRQVVARHGAEIAGESGLLNQLSLLVAPEELRALASEDTVRWVDEIPPPYVVFNDGVRGATGVTAVQDSPYELYGTGVTVGIWDAGAVEATHDDFEDQSGSSRVTAGDVVTVSDHSTHVGGTVAGNGARSAALGGTYRQWRGVAPHADIVSYDASGNLGAELLEAIVTYTIDLSQNSWGANINEAVYTNCHLYGDYDAGAQFYDLVVTGALGRRIPVVFAAGNERNDGDCGMGVTPPYGGNYGIIPPPTAGKNVINVGAANSHDDSMTLFSSWGPVDDGRLLPQVVAPGCEENPVRLDAVYSQTIWSTWPGNGYSGSCGTSMAAPVVSGIAALLTEQYERTYGTAPLPSTIKALLVHGAVDLDDGTAWYNTGPDYASGYGRVDARASADLVIDRALREDVISADDETDVFTITVPTGLSLLKVTLAWDDPAAIQNAIPTLVNDLDLVVRDPSMTIHDPWVLNPGSPAADATRGTDRTNNLEQVLVDSPAAGTWTISVRGYDVPLAPQDYSLVSQLLAYQHVYLPLVLRSYSAATVNEPPHIPTGPSPADGALDQDVDVDLSWTGGDPDGDGVTYDVYVANGDVADPDVLACYDLATATCEPGTLGAAKQYSWRVVTTDEHGARSIGPVWDLTTEAGAQPSLRGTVTEDGAPLQGTDLLLRFYDGSGYSTYDTATTGSNGGYQFTSLPSLGTGQHMYVRWQNTESNPGRLWSWQCGPIWPTTADPAAFQCDFDVDNIALTGPPSGDVTLPVTFTWQIRPFASDDYVVEILGPGAMPWWSSPDLGYVGEYTLASLCAGCEYGVEYDWWVWVWGANGGGDSFYIGHITFVEPAPREPPAAFPDTRPDPRGAKISGDRLRALTIPVEQWREPMTGEPRTQQ